MSGRVSKGVAMVWLLAFNLSACAEVYQWTDAKGQRHYGDRPGENANTLSIGSGSLGTRRVEKVYDGDTVLLDNGEKVRFLGINTPEVGGHRHQEQMGGREAKQWLRDKLEGKTVRLEFDVEHQDHYQRTLAYVFTADHEHINLSLVRNGLATVNIYPPNLRYLDALLAAQKEAEHARRGLWGMSAYQPIEAGQMDEVGDGWLRVVGRIQAIKQGPKNVYLQFSGQQAVQIQQSNLPYFGDLQQYVGKRVEARGWLHRNGERYAVTIRHPADLIVLP